MFDQYEKFHIHSRKCDCFFPLEIIIAIHFLSSRRTPRGQTKRVFYLRPLDHLRILKMRLLCKIKLLLNEDEYVVKKLSSSSWSLLLLIRMLIKQNDCMITCRERVKACGSFYKSYQVSNILLVCYSKETAAN